MRISPEPGDRLHPHCRCAVVGTDVDLFHVAISGELIYG